MNSKSQPPAPALGRFADTTAAMLHSRVQEVIMGKIYAQITDRLEPYLDFAGSMTDRRG